MTVREMVDGGTSMFRVITPTMLFLLTIISTMVFNKMDTVEKTTEYLTQEVNSLDKRVTRAEFTLYGDGSSKKKSGSYHEQED